MLEPSYTFYKKYKQPIATYDVMGQKYQLIVYRMANLKNLPIHKFIQLKWNSGNNTWADVSYNISIQSRYIQFHDANTIPSGNSSLNLDFNGDILRKPIYTDSTVGFSIKLKKMIAQYVDGEILFMVDKKTNLSFKSAAVELLFLKKEGDIYMLLLSPKNDDSLPRTQNFNYSLLQGTHN